MQTNWKTHLILVALISTLLIACGSQTRSLGGGFSLEFFLDGNAYYVLDHKGSKEPGGVFEGTVDYIGWNKKWVIARVNRLYKGDPSGWYVLNLETRKITGPFPVERIQTNKNWSDVSLLPVAEAFGKL